ncbi:MAG: hypothetical protein KAG66_06345, partial [Methylococcales bacterium]|nr:hypothetical protein [Methylococcales bacterium]
LILRQTPATDSFNAIDQVTETGRAGTEIDLEVQGNIEQVMQTALSYGLVDIDILPVTLEEIFLSFYGQQNGGNEHV